jgi:FRG domain
MSDLIERWKRLHVLDLADLRERWRTRPEDSGKSDDRLMDVDRWNEHKRVWIARNEIELVRLLGGLQVLNPKHTLFFRGESEYWEDAPPGRYRKGNANKTPAAVKWLNEHASSTRALRDRGRFARLAILQHYGCPTSLIDVTSNVEIACAFAFEKDGPHESHLRAYALPRHTDAVTVFDDADAVLVDLRAELPSYCARPHVQAAAFIARRQAICLDVDGEEVKDVAGASLKHLELGQIRLDFLSEGRERFYIPRLRARTLYPAAGLKCDLCGTESDMNADFMLHYLRCLAEKHRVDAPASFPDRYAEETESVRASLGM